VFAIFQVTVIQHQENAYRRGEALPFFLAPINAAREIADRASLAFSSIDGKSDPYDFAKAARILEAMDFLRSEAVKTNIGETINALG
jgi:hypothetical protein